MGFYCKVELRYQIPYCGFLFFSSSLYNLKRDKWGLKNCSGLDNEMPHVHQQSSPLISRGLLRRKIRWFKLAFCCSNQIADFLAFIISPHAKASPTAEFPFLSSEFQPLNDTFHHHRELSGHPSSLNAELLCVHFRVSKPTETSSKCRR